MYNCAKIFGSPSPALKTMGRLPISNLQGETSGECFLICASMHEIFFPFMFLIFRNDLIKVCSNPWVRIAMYTNDHVFSRPIEVIR